MHARSGKPADGTLFDTADFALLRAAVFPLARADEADLDSGVDSPENCARIADYVRKCTEDQRFLEALAVASPALAGRVAAIRAGELPGFAALRKAALAVTRYWLRMSTRATPFGTMAGVTVARLDGSAANTEVRFGSAHHRAVRADAGWLTGLVREWECQPRVLARLRVVVNDLCYERGDRVVVPYLPDRTDRALVDVEVTEASIKNTAAVRAVLEIAARPTGAAELVALLCERFPPVTEAAVLRMLSQLVEHEVLLTDLLPPLAHEDPLATVIERGLAVGDELRTIQRALEEYAAEPLGAFEGLDAARLRMRSLRETAQPVQVDLALDAELRLPAELGAEAAAAASVLWRLSSTDPQPALREYRAEFLERYGFERLVPVKELLNPDVGMGPPGGYHVPAATRPEPEEAEEPAARGRFLGQLVQQALLDGKDEIVLDERMVERIADDTGTPPASAELCVQVLAESVAGLAEGRFRLAVSPAVGTSRAGSMFGRFARLFSAEENEALSELIRRAQPGDSTAAQLSFRAHFSRGGNVSQVPRWLDREVTVSGFAEAGTGLSLGLDDLAIGTDADRLFVYSRTLGERIAPTAFHVVNIQRAAPNVVRFLAEVAADGTRPMRGWNWGRLGRLPYLPRVRYGRTILSAAMWHLDGDEQPDGLSLLDERLGEQQWDQALLAWRSRLRVPDRVYLNRADQRILLDLSGQLHRQLLRAELVRRSEILLSELPGSASEYGWLSGHVSELVLPLIRTQRCSSERGPRMRPAPERQARAEHLPGGEWLYLRLTATTSRHREILATAVSELVATLPEHIDRWFFLRYRDVDAHLRLRFHGPQQVLADFLPRLHSWAGTLRAAGLVRSMGLDTYEPELERYGGPEAMTAAERVFAADSAAALAQLRLLHTNAIDVDPLLLAAANAVATVRAFHPEADHAVDVLTALFDKDETHKTAFVRARKQAMALIDPYRDPREPPALAGFAVQPEWARRATALTEYAGVLDELGDAAWTGRDRVLRVLLHLQFNRLYGIAQEQERCCQVVSREAARAHRDRRRFVS